MGDCIVLPQVRGCEVSELRGGANARVWCVCLRETATREGERTTDETPSSSAANDATGSGWKAIERSAK